MRTEALGLPAWGGAEGLEKLAGAPERSGRSSGGAGRGDPQERTPVGAMEAGRGPGAAAGWAYSSRRGREGPGGRGASPLQQG